MSNDQSKTTPSFYAVGHLTGDAVWITPDIPSLIEALIGDPEYRMRSPAGRLTARERGACELATRTQAGLLHQELAADRFSWEGASLPEIDRLTRAREITDRDGPWHRSPPLILVQPADPSWKRPAGLVKAISPRSDSSLLWGMRDLGWLESIGRLDSTGGVDDKF
jgi:hypothetical protein